MNTQYVILFGNITGFGGGQQYVRNLYCYLKSVDKTAVVITSHPGEIIIEEMKQFDGSRVKEMGIRPAYLSKKKKARVLGKIEECAGTISSETIIISLDLVTSLWGELIAKEYNSQNFTYILDEPQIFNYTKPYVEYLKFKLDQSSLVGITPRAVHDLLRNFYDIPIDEKYCFRAGISNVVDFESSYDEIQLPQADFTIGGIWRTDKPGFMVCFQEVAQYIVSHPKKNFNVVIIGAGGHTNEDNLKKLYGSIPNVKLFFTGFMKPLCAKFIREMDVSVSTAGSAWTCAALNVPTITVTSADGELLPLGILDYTTRNTVDVERTNIPLSKLLSMVLEEKYCESHSKLGIEYGNYDWRFINTQLFSAQLDIIHTVDNRGNYYETGKIRPGNAIEQICGIVCRLLGTNAFFGLSSAYLRHRRGGE